MAAIGAIVGLLGTGLQVMASIQQGKAQEAAAEFEAKQREKAAAEEFAAGQRAALDKARETDEVLSRQRALAAASGGGVQDASILDIYEDTAQRGAYNEAVARYGGEERAKGQLDAAAAARLKGKSAAQGAMLSGIASGISGFGQIFKNYG